MGVTQLFSFLVGLTIWIIFDFEAKPRGSPIDAAPSPSAVYKASEDEVSAFEREIVGPAVVLDGFRDLYTPPRKSGYFAFKTVQATMDKIL